jgi:hypothetical protein
LVNTLLTAEHLAQLHWYSTSSSGQMVNLRADLAVKGCGEKEAKHQTVCGGCQDYRRHPRNNTLSSVSRMGVPLTQL